MPYTSPISRSPLSSASQSPCSSRRSSIQFGSASTSRADLPRSTSYLSRHCRSTSLNSFTPINRNLPNQGDQSSEQNAYTSSSLRPSPSPITNIQSIPNGAVMSPPESTNNSSDDETPPATSYHHTRGGYLGKVSDISTIKRNVERNREITSSRSSNTEVDGISPGKYDDINSEIQPSPINNSEKKCPGKLLLQSPMITGTQSILTRTKLFSENPTCTSALISDEESASDDGDEYAVELKPSMVRKKSGELVRPALRTPLTRRRPSSVPGTPTFSKAVHFDSHLEHIRHFLQVDRPLAVSAGSSPVPAYENEDKFPFEDEMPREISFEWEIIITNFPAETTLRLAQVVRVERVFLSYDYQKLVGSVVVRNLAFNKYVVVRFTLDYWKTTSEVVAEFNQDVRQPILDGYDRFNFNIKLSDQANLEAKTMFFCVKYCVNGKEYWDNNNAANFQVDFRKKFKTINKKNETWSTIGCSPSNSGSKLNILPRSNARSPSRRPKSMSFIDDYGDGFGNFQLESLKPMFDDYFGDIGAAVVPWDGDGKNKIQNNESVSEPQQRGSGQLNGNAFSNRYNFGASLSAAINAQNIPLRQRGVAKNSTQDFSDDLSRPVSPRSEGTVQVAKETIAPKDISQAPSVSYPSSLSKPGLSSQSYNDLLDKYCFFGSTKQAHQQKVSSAKSNTDSATSEGTDYHDSTKDGKVLNTSMEDGFRLSSSKLPNGSRRSRSPSSTMTASYALGMYPSYQNHHDGHNFFEAHAATAIRG